MSPAADTLLSPTLVFLAGPAVPLLSAFGGWLMGSTVGAVVARIAIVVGASLLQAGAQKRKMKRALANQGLDQGRMQMLQDPLAPRRLIYGETLVGGVITFYYQHPSSSGYHYMVLTLATHPVQAISHIRIDNQQVSLDAAGNVTSGPYAGGVIQIRKFLGAAAGQRDTAWESELPAYWTPQHLGHNIARLHIRLKWDADKFPNSLPAFSALVQGAKVYDPRNAAQSPTNPASWTYSNNAALCCAHFLHTRKGVSYSRIVKAALIAAANVCSEQVTRKDGTTEPRYRTGGLYTYDQNPIDALADLTETMAGSIVDAGGQWTIRAGAWTAPVLPLSDSDIVSEFRCTPRASAAETYNAVRGTYYSPHNDWAPADFPAVKNDTYREWDGGRRLYKDVSYPYITHASQAQRVAKIDLERARQSLVIEADFNARALRVQPGDIIALHRPRLGWAAKPFEVLKWELKTDTASEAQSLDGAAAPTLKVTLTAQETAPAVYDWNHGEETTVDLAPNLGSPLVHTTAAPVNFALAQPTANEETALPRIKATWTKPANPLVVSGGKTELSFRKDTETVWTHWSLVDGAQTHDFVNDLAPNAKVWVRARHVSNAGVRSAWVQASITPLATNPVLELSHGAIGRMANGSFHSTHLIIKAKAAGQPYAGRFRVRLQVSATEYHQHLLSTSDQTQHNFALQKAWGTVLNVEVSLYRGGSYPNVNTTTPIELKHIPVIKNGQDGLPGAPGAPGGGGTQYTLALMRQYYDAYDLVTVTEPIGGGGPKNAGQVVPLSVPSQFYKNGKTYLFDAWSGSYPAASWIANPTSPNTSIVMNGPATLYATYNTTM